MQEPFEQKQYSGDEFAELGDIFSQLRELAKKYKKITGGGHLGITGEIAEYEAARVLGYKMWSARTPGFDLSDADGKKYQVKGYGARKKSEGSIPTVNASVPGKAWDFVLLVILDEEYHAIEIYKVASATLESFFDTRAEEHLSLHSKPKKQPRAINPAQFKRLAGNDPVWRKAQS